MTRILVTGADGFVGSHVVASLRSRPVDIHVVARNADKANAARALGLSPHIVALEDVEALRTLAKDMNGIAHLAASDNPAFLPVNDAAIKAMISGLPGDSSFVMHGGSMVFGDTGPAMLTGQLAMNAPPPLAGRAALDQSVLDAAFTGARTHIVYGSLVFGGRGAMIPNTLVTAAKAAGYSGLIGNGAAIWSAVHILDWADLIVRVLIDGKTSGQPVFAAAQPVSMRDVADMVANAFTPVLPVRPVSMDDAMGLWSFFAPGFAIHQNFDVNAAREAYGWNPPLRDIAAEFAALAAQPAGTRL